MTSPIGPNTMINSLQANHHDAPGNTEPFPIRDSMRFRNGSLPLKKRRLYDAIPLWELQVNNKVPASLAPSLSCTLSGTSSENAVYTSSSPSASLLQGKSIISTTSSDEKIAVLALVAAAATAGHATESPMPVMNPFSSNTLLGNSTKEYAQDEQSISSKTVSSKRSSSSSTPTEINNNTVNNNNGKTEKEGTTLRPSGRIHHPPLSNPLPNGCHGRTSRNNSYCRRQPCYNGSKYCKLHYQHYVIAGIRPPDDMEAASPTCIPVEGNNSATPEAPAPATTVPQVVATQHGPQQQQQQQPLQQDKRFTGCDDEVRCEATTTRGRACAYVAVQGTKYCYLHADYDTNPPPRRGGGVGGGPGVSSHATGKPKLASTTATTPFAAHKRVTIVGHDQLAASPETVDVAPLFDKTMYSSSPPSVTSEESYAPSISQVAVVASGESSATDVGKPTSDDGSFPLLSTISPDQWYGKRVCIATGPLVGRTGIVEKWGNGWVGVRVSIGTGGMSDPHLHNRRALELYLLPDQEDTNTSASSTTTTTGYQVENPLEEAMNRDNAVLRRCVSREADAAEARELMESNTKDGDEDVAYSMKEAARSQNTTPCFPTEVECDAQEMKYNEATAEETHHRGTMIPESPMTPAHGMHMVDFSVSNFHFIPRSCDESSNLSGGDGHFSSSASVGGTMAATVTPKPISPRKVRVDEDLPLVQSLLLAQEGMKRKGSLDLLFGTAALERSRRTVHKPERYEDKAMLIRKRGKDGEPECPSPKHSPTP